MADDSIALAAIAGAHGISGEVRLKLFAESADSLKRHAQVRVGDRLLTLASVKGARTLIVRFAEVSDRNAAEALRGQLLTVPRAALPPLEEGEYYHADLIGLPCESKEGRPLGHVVAVEDFGAGELLEIEKPDGRRVLLPFREGVAELAGGCIVADEDFLA